MLAPGQINTSFSNDSDVVIGVVFKLDLLEYIEFDQLTDQIIESEMKRHFPKSYILFELIW